MQYSTRMLLLTPTDASCISLTHQIYFYFSSITHIFPSFTARKAPETNYDTKSIQSAGAASIAEQYGAAAVVAPPQAARQSVRSVSSLLSSMEILLRYVKKREERKRGREEEKAKWSCSPPFSLPLSTCVVLPHLGANRLASSFLLSNGVCTSCPPTTL